MIPPPVNLRGTLRWTQPKALSQQFELQSGTTPIGSLNIRGIARTIATAACGEEHWTFRREGFWRKRAVVLHGDGPKELARFDYNTWNPGGTLRLPNGHTFAAESNFWQTVFTVRESGGAVIVTFRTEGVFHLSANVEIHASMYDRPELPMILCFGWYLVVMMQHDAAVTASV